jgi:2-hydroxychromene-2-carboxylate isomerase
MDVVTFYYDVVCPFAYLASTRIEELCSATGAHLRWQPILLGGLLRSLGNADPMASMPAAKVRMTRLDALRWAEHLGVPLAFPAGHPRRTLDAQRLLIATSDPATRTALSHALYRAYWVDDRDPADRSVLSALAGRPVEALLDDPEVKHALRGATEEAERQGAFGVPTCVVDTTDGGRYLFFGQDRLPLCERVLRGWRPRCG